MRQIVARTVCSPVSLQRYTHCLNFVHAIHVAMVVQFALLNNAG